MLITHCHFFFFPFFKLVLIITWIITGQTIFVFIFHLKPIWNSFYKFILFVFYLKNRYEILFLKFILLSSIPKTYWNSFHKIHSFIFYLKNIFEILFMKFIFFLSQKHIWNYFYKTHSFLHHNTRSVFSIKNIIHSFSS